MADFRITLPLDLLGLRGRAEAVAMMRRRFYTAACLGDADAQGGWTSVPLEIREVLVQAVLLEMADLSIPSSQSAALLWLASRLMPHPERVTAQPGWYVRPQVGYRLALGWNTSVIDFIEPGPMDTPGTFYAQEGYVALPGVSKMSPMEAMRAALLALQCYQEGPST